MSTASRRHHTTKASTTSLAEIDGERDGEVEPPRSARAGGALRLLRLLVSWALALALLVVGLPAAVGVSWHVVLPVISSLQWLSVLILVAVWIAGLYVHTFLVTAAAHVTRPQAMTVHVTGSAVASVMPFGGAASLEVHRRMLRSWGVGGGAFVGYALLINLWGIGCKLLLPVTAVVSLWIAHDRVTPQLDATAFASGAGFVVLAAAGAALLVSQRSASAIGGAVEGMRRACLGRQARGHQIGAVAVLSGVRRDCCVMVSEGWRRMSVGIAGYTAFQCLLLGICLHLAGAGNSLPEVVTGFAVERMVTLVPITPGGVGIGDLGLVTVLIGFGGNPAGVAAAALLYRSFVFVVEVPTGACLLGAWLLRRKLTARSEATPRQDLVRRVSRPASNPPSPRLPPDRGQ